MLCVCVHLRVRTCVYAGFEGRQGLSPGKAITSLAEHGVKLPVLYLIPLLQARESLP